MAETVIPVSGAPTCGHIDGMFTRKCDSSSQSGHINLRNREKKGLFGPQRVARFERRRDHPPPPLPPLEISEEQRTPSSPEGVRFILP